MMSTLPSTAEVSGVHVLIYESYYNLVDPNHHGRVGALDAAKFLKKSHLSDIILSKIWDLADPESRGYLDKRGMFAALKLCALAQQGHNLNILNLHMDIDPPKMGDILNTIKSAPCTHSSFTPTVKGNWSISPLEKAKYEQLFRSLEPINGYIPGNKVKGVLMDSQLPLETLGKIWDLADIDKDGKLNQQEFTIAMHLVYKALEKYTVPSELPAELVNIKASQTDMISKIDVLLTSVSGAILPTDSDAAAKEIISLEWVVSNEDKVNSDKLFVQADEDLDGFVSGIEIKDIFFQSGLTQTVLAQIWSLCDISQNGKLNNEQFALAMWLIKKKLHGVDLPKKLTPEMIPPSFRQKSAQTILDNNNLCAFSNPELDMISKDIKELIQEKHGLEQDISQKEADIKIKNGEIKSLQSELDTLAATLKQLDNQKVEAQKRLNDLQTQVEKLRQQASDQESNLHVHESELNNKRQEIECLKEAEQNLETKQHSCNQNLNSLSQLLQSVQLQISQTKAKMTQLEEQQRQIVDVITQYDAALTIGDASVITDSLLAFKAQLNRTTMLVTRIGLNSQGRLILRESGKLIIPYEQFGNAVMMKHLDGPHGLHLTAEGTIRAIIEHFTIGKENFGMEKEFIVEMVQNCPNPTCRFYKNQAELSQKSVANINIAIPSHSGTSLSETSDNRSNNSQRSYSLLLKKIGTKLHETSAKIVPTSDSFKLTEFLRTNSDNYENSSNLQTFRNSVKEFTSLDNEMWVIDADLKSGRSTTIIDGQDKIIRSFAEVMKNMSRMKSCVRPAMCKPYGKQSETLQKTLIDTIQLIQSLRSFLPPPHISVSSWKTEDKHGLDHSNASYLPCL